MAEGQSMTVAGVVADVLAGEPGTSGTPDPWRNAGLHVATGVCMEESGARLNRDRPERLAAACRLIRAIRARPETETQSQSQIRVRAGAIQQAVIQALAQADRPLRAREVHAAAEKLVGQPLSWNTVKDCLHKRARRSGTLVERVGHGRYRHL